MSVRPSLFNTRINHTRQGNTVPNPLGQEIDLRDEMDNILFGENDGPRHGNLILIRNMRRDADGYPTRCVCSSNQTTVEADPDCSYCLGEGYLWDENWAWTFWMYAGADSGFVRYIRMPPGEIKADYKIFFFRYNTNIANGDKIVEVILDDEGDVALPYVREAIYKPQTLAKRRLDNGRAEYIAAFCREDDAIRTDNPR